MLNYRRVCHMLGWLALVWLPGFFSAVAIATEPERPQIGLVLGGGGARGIAHVGVLKVLEEMRVPIARIAGTSMGAVLGGLYAAGYSAAQLERIVTSLDWVALFDDDPPREQLSFRRKQDDRDDVLKLELGIDERGLLLSRGFVEGHKLTLVLRRLLAPLPQDLDFDALGVPFRAVATDIETGDPVVLGRGDLARAIRASMAVPGVLTPDEIDGRFLIDGGISNNLPVDVIQAQVGLVIAVKVSAELKRAKALRSVLDVSDQAVNTVLERNQKAQLQLLGERDIVLQPALGDIASGEFARAREAVQAGYEAAAVLRERLAPLALEPAAYARYQEERRALLERRIIPGRIRVTTDSRLDPRILRDRIRALPGVPLDPGALQSDIEDIYGLDYFERVDFQLLETDGQMLLDIDARQKAWGPNYLRAGVALRDDFQGGNSFDLSVRLTRVPVNQSGAEWRNIVRVGQRPLAFTEFFQPLASGSNLFGAASLQAGADTREVSLSDDARVDYRINAADAGLDLGYQFGNVAELRAGIFDRRSRIAPRLDNPEVDPVDRYSAGWRLRFAYDSLDSLYFPSRGRLLQIDVKASRTGFGADESYEILDASLISAHRLDRGALVLRAELSDLRNSDAALLNLRPLGGFLNLSGLAPGEISG
ncbi:MAG: patatin-like phospholipase family protein, partial [Gammaproteobacteria bacterium]|nr:patatin-like phospholipase family protein [Gammaproteobacteria bacterium]